MLKRNHIHPEGFDGDNVDGFFMVARSDAALAISHKLTGSQLRLWFHLLMIGAFAGRNSDGRLIYGSLPSSAEIASNLGCHRRTVEKDLDRFAEIGLCEFVQRSERNTIEDTVCDRLHSQLGGLREVETPVGRIDLLTDTEIIEVKNIKDWKAAIGQVLAYSGFFPEHRKRLHLFGKKGEMVTSTAVTICAELGITVTFEEVG
ncbi:hypothetical protein BZZ01_05075 [Nostocales cyanobacterium HT-58-2]|nr:hypothetical protein BZZ01_05075 [Nostocales cyanobacterium HT-58-2]